MFFWNSVAFSVIQQMLESLVSLPFSKFNLNIWKFSVHVLLKPGLENFEHYFASIWDECNCAVVWTFFGIAFLWDWNENWPFLGLWLCRSQETVENSEMRISNHLTTSWEICMRVKKQQFEPDMEQQTGSKSGKEYVKAVYIVTLFI